MAGTLVIDTLTDGSGNSTSATNAIRGSAKAWVNFNGSTGSIRASYNVGSITKNGTGDFTVNITNALADASYNAHASASYASSQSSRQTVVNMCTVGARTAEQAPTTTSFRFTTSAVESGSNYDPTYCFFSAFR